MTETSYTAGETDVPLLTDTIGDNLARTVETFPDRDALIDVPSGRRWTYRQLLDEVDVVAAGLLAAGVSTGDRVGIWAPNCPEWVLVQYATARMGAILVNINPAYRSHELRYVLQQSGIRMIVASPSFRTSDYRAMIEEVSADCVALEFVVLIGTETWDRLLADGRAADPRTVIEAGSRLSASDAINIQYTSGTTGFPKGATLSHRNILNNGFFVGELVNYTENDRVCVPVPFYHCFGMVMGNLAATSHGSAIVIAAPAFDPEQSLKAVAQEGCTSLYGVPTMFIAELALPTLDSFDLSTLRTGIMAGSPCPTEVMNRVIDRMGMAEVSIAYGMTETSPVALQTRADDTIEQRVSTVGRVGPHLEVAVMDPVTRDFLPRGEAGELCIRGYSVMIGYWNEPAKTSDAIDSAGWMHTGDIGVMDGDGYVSVTGRIKDMVIRGGENIYPREVEEFLYTHPDIVDAQVIGVPDDKYGEELMVWVRLREGAPELTADALRTFCDGKLARYKIPRYVHLVDEFPMTVTGKVRKAQMREDAVALLEP